MKDLHLDFGRGWVGGQMTGVILGYRSHSVKPQLPLSPSRFILKISFLPHPTSLTWTCGQAHVTPIHTNTMQRSSSNLQRWYIHKQQPSPFNAGWFHKKGHRSPEEFDLIGDLNLQAAYLVPYCLHPNLGKLIWSLFLFLKRNRRKKSIYTVDGRPKS